MTDGRPPERLAASVIAGLVGSSLTLATAESLTGGGVGALLTSVPGASAVYAGGVIAYSGAAKATLLAVPPELVAEHGVVSAPCALAMAAGARVALGADLGVSTTGVAGPDPQEGKPVGLVYVAVADATGREVRELRLSGDRASIRAATTLAALTLVQARMEP
jgi:nicotinamide-nucleotide amidase